MNPNCYSCGKEAAFVIVDRTEGMGLPCCFNRFCERALMGSRTMGDPGIDVHPLVPSWWTEAEVRQRDRDVRLLADFAYWRASVGNPLPVHGDMSFASNDQ